jgi:hypothetical protein
MPDKNQTEATTDAGSDQAKPDVAQPNDTKAEAISTATVGDELSEDDLEAVAWELWPGHPGVQDPHFLKG